MYAKTVEELFQNCAEVLFFILLDQERSDIDKKERNVKLSAPTKEDLLVFWLNELISLFFTYGFFPDCYNIEIKHGVDNVSLSALLRGEEKDISLYDLKTEVKAATYHDIKIERNKDGLSAEVIFDL